MAAGPPHPMVFGGSAAPADPLQHAALALNAERPQEAQRIAEQILKANPGNGRALHILGCALLMQGRAEDSITPFEMAARGRNDPEIETQLATALLQTGQHDDALTLLKRATKRRPPYARAFHALGQLLFSMKRYDEAADRLRSGLEIAPMMPELSVQLGLVLLARRDFAGARPPSRGRFALFPILSDALLGMGQALQEVGESEAATEYFRRYLSRNPNDAGTWLCLGHCLLEARPARSRL